jgi:tetratricopeptide (TPR) repeat protein
MTQKNPTTASNITAKMIVLAAGFSLLISNTTLAVRTWSGRKNVSCRTLRSMARVYMAYGEYSKAQPIAEQALSLAKSRNVGDSELALGMIDLAIVYLNQGKLAEAERLCKKGLQLQQKALYENHPYLAQTLRTLSSIYKEQGKYPQAEAALGKAVSIMLESHSKDDKAMAPFQVDIAKLSCAQHKFKKAEAYYQRAMKTIKTTYGPEHLYTANVMADMANLYIQQKNYTKAEALLDSSLKVQKKIYGSEHHSMAESWLTKAKLYQAKGEYNRSEKLIKTALSTVKKSGNMGVLARLEQRAERIRTDMKGNYGLVTKAVR